MAGSAQGHSHAGKRGRFIADSACAMQLQLPHVPVPVLTVTKFVALRQGEGQTIPFPIYSAHLGILVHETA
jgi:hypothetical protein